MKKHQKHSKYSHGGGSSSSSGAASSGYGSYSHVDAKPDTIKKRMKELGDDMQNTLRRIDALEKKVKRRDDHNTSGSASLFDDFMSSGKSSKHFH